MKIELHKITIGQLTEGYHDDAENGVIGYGGLLDIRPPYQREFVYGEKERNAVITTVKRRFPLNVMYWVVRPDGHYEVMDGQQRTVSICQFVAGDFMHDLRYFHRMPEDERKKILDYELLVYFCEGKPSETIDWFETINIAGKPLYPQEIRNAIYQGPWIADAKRYFSKTNCPAQQRAAAYLAGTANRQDYLETAIKWAAKTKTDEGIRAYMALHQGDANASQLWRYVDSVVTWIEANFKHSKDRAAKILNGLDWGTLYDKFGDEVLDQDVIEETTQRLLADEYVDNKKGIIPYILTHDEKWLHIRAFSDKMKIYAYEKQRHHCANPNCPDKEREFDISEMEADHITPWCEGGATDKDNCQMLCRLCNRRKGSR